ncbi:NACHT domain-containing protein [Pseudomonas sp. Irchel 3A18]|uniref:NACHT domain-containing protein n=1 Tax=Pseudomonas sp. Irchel 3A18 TaxID=2008905 RepID=UPI00117AEF7E|nr:NACHT domain-containing protein [Pseudomonas sp. Irchel 3A18]
MSANGYEEIFGPFADPATDICIEKKLNETCVSIYRNGEARQYSINEVSGRVRDTLNKRGFANLNSLLASSDFADLKALASTQLRMLAAIGSSPFLNPNYTSSESNSRVTGIEHLSSMLGVSEKNTTKIVLLDGPAGIGKTYLLQRLTWERAQAYTASGKNSPVLYIGSRGAKLSNLRAELAAATQQMRANFTFDQVPVLVRRGLLDLAIDGFDELVDADGYHDAWHALQSFLAEISGSGICILAGRDTFFDQQGFLARLDASKYSIQLVQLHLLLAEPQQALKWLLQNKWSEQGVSNIQSILKHNSYALRPYFLSVLADNPDWQADERAKTVRGFLVDRFLDRESQLIKKMLGGDDAQIRDALCRMFEDAATDMFEREQGEVDVEYLSMLCELSFDKVFPQDEIRKLTHKAGSFGLLEPGASVRMRKFPHSEILHHFLSRALLDDLHANKLSLALRRGVLGGDFLEVFQEVIEHESASALNGALSNLTNLIGNDFSSDRLQANGAAILLASLSRSLSSDSRILKNLQINECSLSGQLALAELEGLNIYRLDARGADFTEVTFKDVSVSMLIADDLTKFGLTRPIVSTIHVTDDFNIETIHDPQSIKEWLDTHGTTQNESFEEVPLFRFFERVCRKAIRQFYFKYSDADPDPTSEFLIDPMWPTLAEILRKHERLDEVLKAVSGPPSVMYHIRDPKSLLQAQDEASINIIKDIVAAGRRG